MQISETEILGAVKIKDGLYIGDEFAAQVFWLGLSLIY
jgi:hypothetical protein